jgi:hypothetical protein
MKTTYKIISGVPFDSDVAVPYWIEQSTVEMFLWWEIKKRKVIGNYFDEFSGNIPFFDFSLAQQRIEQIKNTNYYE